MYVHPAIYEFGIQFLYWGGLKKLKQMFGEEKSIFEPASGYGRIKKYIPESCVYRGIDLNPSFVKYGQKKGLDIKLGDIFDPTLYPASDMVLLCDILHHLSDEKMRELLDLSVKFSREKVVIVEPAFVSIASSSNIFSRLLSRFFSMADADGINDIDRWLSEADYQTLFDHIRSIAGVKELIIEKHRFHYFIQVLLT